MCVCVCVFAFYYNLYISHDDVTEASLKELSFVPGSTLRYQRLWAFDPERTPASTARPSSEFDAAPCVSSRKIFSLVTLSIIVLECIPYQSQFVVYLGIRLDELFLLRELLHGKSKEPLQELNKFVTGL